MTNKENFWIVLLALNHVRLVSINRIVVVVMKKKRGNQTILLQNVCAKQAIKKTLFQVFVDNVTNIKMIVFSSVLITLYWIKNWEFVVM